MKFRFIILLPSIAFGACNQSKTEKIYDENTQVSYYENGKEKCVVPYQNGKMEGEAITYRPTGKINFSINYQKGLKNGKGKWYYTDGSICRILDFKNDSIDGWRKDYLPTGQLLRKIPYSKDEVVVGGTEYRNDGTPIPEPKIVVKTIQESRGITRYTFELSEPVEQVQFSLADFRLNLRTEKKGKYVQFEGSDIKGKQTVYARFVRKSDYVGVVSTVLNL